MSALTQMLETWEARSRSANPCDAMLINKHLREVRELLAANAVSKQVMGFDVVVDPTMKPNEMKMVQPQAPYANCRYRICDLPGQCKGEGKCHHPAVAQAQGEPVPEWYLPRIIEVRTRLASLSSAMRPDDSLGIVLGNLSGQLASCERVALRYAAPKALAPLTQPEVVEAFCDTRHNTQYVSVFDAGVRFAEKHHGIGGAP